jgi:hypothetical protein
MKRFRLLTVVAAAAVVTTSCHGFVDIWGPGSAVRPYYCDPTDVAINDGHHEMMPGMPPTPFMLAYTEQKGPLSSADCKSVTTDLRAASTYASQFGTVADAEAAGWIQATVWTEGQGIHYVDPARLTGPFDPQRPNWLMYDGTAADSGLTGMMFLTDTGSTTPPAGFAGDNDHFHQHGELCYDPTPDASPFIIGEHMTDAECAAIGGFNITFGTIWMVHVWLPVYDGWVPTDVFNKSHPNIP